MTTTHTEDGDGRPRATLHDFASVDWQNAVADISSRRLSDYAARFGQRAKEAAERDDARTTAVFQSLADLCSLSLRVGHPNQPFAPWMVTDGFRTAGVEDLSDETVAAAGSLASGTADPRLRAHLADVAWVRGRDYRAAKIAVEGYLALVASLDSEGWPGEFHYLERALELALQLGRVNEELGRVRQFVEERLAHLAPTDDGFLSAKLMSVLLQFADVDSARYLELASDLARRALAAKAFHIAREYWTLAADWAARANDPDRRRAALRRIGESFVAEAEEALPRPVVGPLQAAAHLERAIEALRRAGGSRERVDELHARLVEIQREGVACLPTISHSADITDFVTEAERAVAGKPLAEALMIFVQCAPILPVDWLRQTAEDHGRRYMLQSLFPKVMLSTDGKVSARQGSATSADPNEREAALRFEMLSLAARYHETLPQMTIDPMRRQIIREHAISADDLIPLLRYGPLVPAGRERIIADGLAAGFYGDLVEATHLLVPQLEHVIRVLLYRAGERVSTFDQYGLQKELDLNRLLYLPALKRPLGEDLVFTLQGLLVEGAGGNIRNRMAHGLMSHAEFFSPSVMYLWWLSLRLCLLPALALATEAAGGAAGNAATGDVSDATAEPNQTT